MKQKMVIKVLMQNEKMKSKAMKIVVAGQGVISVTVEKENDKMVVIGEGIDAACLTMSLRKKFCNVEILSVEEEKPPAKPPVKPPPPPPPPPCLPPPCPPYPPCYCPGPPVKPPPPCLPPPCPPYPPCYCPGPCQAYDVCPVNDPNPPNCSIM